jgi:hypothetical protein
VNNVHRNIGVQVSIKVSVLNSFWYIPGVELLDHMVFLCLTFGGPHKLLSVTFYISVNKVQGIQFVNILVNIC